MGKKKDKKERKRREREAAAEEADVQRLEAQARAQPADEADPAADPLLVPPAEAQPLVELPPTGPFPGVTPPAVLKRAVPRDVVPGPRADSPATPIALTARELVSRIGGASLCYGEPITAPGRTVIPVGKVRARGGMGFGSGQDGAGDPSGGGGGGGMVDASPLGFIEVTADGTHFTPIPAGPEPLRGRAGTGLALLAGAAAGIAGAALAGRRRGSSSGLRRISKR